MPHPAVAQPASQQLRIAVAYAPKTLDPALAADAASARLLQLTNPALLGMSPQFRPEALVGACTQAKTLTRVTCTLPQGLMFSDGTPLTAAQLKGWYGYLQTNARSAFSGVLKPVSITTPAPQTLTFSLPSPTLTFLNKLTEIPLAPSPTDPSATAAAAGLAMGARPGLGSYRLAGADALGNVTLTPVTPASPSLVFITIADATTRLLKLKKHEVEVVQNDLPPELFAWGKAQGFGALAVPSSSYTYLGYNFRNEVLRSATVREAIAHSVDRPAIRQYLLGGLATPASTLLPPGHPLAWNAPEEGPDVFEAEDMLDTVLFRGPGGPRATLTLLTSTDALSQRLAQVLQQQLAKVGLALKIQPTEWGAFFDRVRQGQYDLVLLSWSGEQPPEFLYYAFHTSQTPPNGLNRGRVSDAPLDTLLEGIMSASTPQALAQSTIAAQKRIADVRPYLPLYRRHHTLLATPGVGSCQLDQAGTYKGLTTCRTR